MHIGIIGRHPGILANAIAAAGELGHTAVGTTSNDEALAWLSDATISALVIGGGVEQPARSILIGARVRAGVRPVEIFGPDKLRPALAALGKE